MNTRHFSFDEDDDGDDIDFDDTDDDDDDEEDLDGMGGGGSSLGSSLGTHDLVNVIHYNANSETTHMHHMTTLELTAFK